MWRWILSWVRSLTESRLTRWQVITVATLLVGYSGYYVCRSNLSVAAPLILKDSSTGLTQETIGMIQSVGLLLYAIGKFSNGVLTDFLDGRRVFLFGMIASVACTFLFGISSGVAVFVVIWAVNRFVQSMGWSALASVAARWFPASRQGVVMGVLSMSYLIGDAAARLLLGSVVKKYDVGWRGLFYLAGTTLGLIAFGSWWTLRFCPGDVGLPEPEDTPPSPGPSALADDAAHTPWTRLRQMLACEPFWQVCLMSFGLNLIRDTFNAWTPTYLSNEVGMEIGSAGIGSMVFPLMGGVAAFAGGWLLQRLGGRPGRVMLPSLILMVLALAVLAVAPLRGRPVEALLLLAAVGTFMTIPYSFCSGVLAVEFGGKRASATAAGVIDGMGYLGAAFSGWGIAAIASRYGWSMAFAVLAATGLVTAAVVGIYLLTTAAPAATVSAPPSARKRRRKQRV